MLCKFLLKCKAMHLSVSFGHFQLSKLSIGRRIIDTDNSHNFLWGISYVIKLIKHECICFCQQKEISMPYNENDKEYETCKVYEVDWWKYSEEESLNYSTLPLCYCIPLGNLDFVWLIYHRSYLSHRFFGNRPPQILVKNYQIF